MSGAVPRHHLLSLAADGSAQAGQTGLWPYTQQRWRPWRARRHSLLDPVNAVVVATAPDQVHTALLADGWHRPDDGAPHATWFEGRFIPMSDHIALGDRAERVHVRLFAIAGHTLVAAHHEVADERGHHIVTSWDRARERLGEALAASGWSECGASEPLLTVQLRGVDGDGRLWRYIRGDD